MKEQQRGARRTFSLSCSFSPKAMAALLSAPIRESALDSLSAASSTPSASSTELSFALVTDGIDCIEMLEMFLLRRGELGEVALVLTAEKEWGVIGEDELEEDVAGDMLRMEVGCEVGGCLQLGERNTLATSPAPAFTCRT